MRQAVGPLDGQDAAMKFFEPEIVGRRPFEAIKIGVIERQPSWVFMHERERRAADVIRIDAEPLSQSADERGLPRSEVSGQQENIACDEAARQILCDRSRLRF